MYFECEFYNFIIDMTMIMQEQLRNIQLYVSI